MRIEVMGLQHRYRANPELVIKPLSYVFEPGTLTAVTGPSGSGKSTLMYILALMLTPSTGRILWDGDDVARLTDSRRAHLRARHVGFVFQDAVLDLARTSLDNVLEAARLAGTPRATAKEHAKALMQRFGVAERATHRPGEISGGQAQRIALCRALVKNPSIIFADEPTGNLDDASACIVWAALEDAARAGATVIVATHDTTRAGASRQHLQLASS